MIQVWKEQVRKEKGGFNLWPLARAAGGAGCRERVTECRRLPWTQPGSAFPPLPWVLPQQWHGLSMKDRNHLYFSPVSSLEAGCSPSEGAGLRCCAGGLTHVQVPEVPWSRTCCSGLCDTASTHPLGWLLVLPHSQSALGEQLGRGMAERARAAAVPGALPVPLAPGELSHPCSLSHLTGTCAP